jgi:hypothetical protein
MIQVNYEGRKKEKRKIERVQRGRGELIYKERNKVEPKESFEEIKFVIKVPLLGCSHLQIPA